MSMRSLAIVLAALTLWCSSALAGVPQQLTYEGRLFDSTGAASQGAHSIKFEIFDALTAGNSLWNETQNVAVVDGLYSVTLGASTPFPASLFDGSVRYLEISVDGDVLSPRQSMGSVAYAIKAGNAETVSNSAVTVDSSGISINLSDGGAQTVVDDTGTWVGAATGLQGPAGATGPQGPAGADGAAGAAGPAGAAAAPGQGRNVIAWSDDLTQWAFVGGTQPAYSTNADNMTGATAFDITTNTGATGAVSTFGDFIPVDPSRHYGGSIWAKEVTGSGTFYAGYAAYDATKTLLTGNGGTYGYFIASAAALTTGTWTHFTGSITGTGAGLNSFPAGTRFIKPLVITNYQNIGDTRVDSFEIYEVDTPEFVSPWTLITADNLNHSFAHGLGSVPSECHAFWSPNASGTPVRPLGKFDSTCNANGLTNGWHGAEMVWDATNVSFYAYSGGNLFCYYAGSWVGSNTGYVKVTCKP